MQTTLYGGLIARHGETGTEGHALGRMQLDARFDHAHRIEEKQEELVWHRTVRRLCPPATPPVVETGEVLVELRNQPEIREARDGLAGESER